MPPGGIRNRNSSKRAAADPRLRPRGHWDRQAVSYTKLPIIRPSSDIIVHFISAQQSIKNVKGKVKKETGILCLRHDGM